MVAATIRTSTRIALLDPIRVTSPYSVARSNRSCAPRGKRRQLVEEQCAAIGLLEAAGARLGGAGEGARLMAEKLGLDQRLGEGGAVHRHQRPGPARAQPVQPLGDQLLARAAFADHQHRPVQRGGTARPLDRIEERPGLADELVVAVHAEQLAYFANARQDQNRRLMPKPTTLADFRGFHSLARLLQ